MRIWNNVRYLLDDEFRALHPQTSFPNPLPAEVIAEFGFVPVIEVDQPLVAWNETAVLGPPEQVDDEWQVTWSVAAAAPAEIAARQQEIRAQIVAAVQVRLDAFASERGYGDAQTSPIVSACSYATSTHPRYGPEGRRCVELREQTWDALFDIEAEVIAGTRPMPTSYDDIAGELPALIWGT